MQCSVRQAVISSLAKLSGTSESEISDADHLFDDLGVDSMMSVNLLMEVEDRLNARLPEGSEGSFVAVCSVGELVRRFDEVFSQESRSGETGTRPFATSHEPAAAVPRTHE